MARLDPSLARTLETRASYRGEELLIEQRDEIIYSSMKFLVVLPDFQNALCAQVDSELFFLEQGQSSRVAKSICAGCEHIIGCRNFAIENNIKYGVWGGTTGTERKLLRRLFSLGEDQ